MFCDFSALHRPVQPWPDPHRPCHSCVPPGEHARFSGGKYGGQNWNYLVTFRLADGEEIELYTGQNEYRQLKEGLAGQLSWHRDNFVSFDFDENQQNYT